MSLFVKISTTLFVAFLGLLIYGELAGNFNFVKNVIAKTEWGYLSSTQASPCNH